MAADGSQKLQALVRSLNLIPYFRTHPDQTPLEAATDLGMRPEELKDAVERLFCSGVGRRTEDLIDLSFNYRDGVTIYNDQGLDKPLRLTPTEAGALLLTLESLEAMPGLVDSAAVLSAAAKLRGIMDEKTSAIYDSLAAADPRQSQAQALVAQGLNERRKLAFYYWSASSDEEKYRVVDPARIFIVDSHTYLAAWDEQVHAHRRFRIDRMREIEILDEKANPHLRQLDFDPEEPFAMERPQHVQLEIHQEFTWLADYHDIKLGEPVGNGYLSATMPVGSVDWFLRFALGESDRLRVTGPKNLVEALAERREKALEGYTR
ncbi:helix-turn-helix transcriptional regulator [Corynebacterium flavescens]